MSDEVVDEAVAKVNPEVARVMAEEDVDQETAELRIDIREKLNLSNAIRDYLVSKEQFFVASEKYNKGCQSLRDSVKPGTRLVVRMTHAGFYGKHYLVTSDDKGEFELQLIEVV